MRSSKFRQEPFKRRRQEKAKEGKTQKHRQRNKKVSKYTYLEDFHNHFLVVGDVDGFKDLAVFATAKFPHKLIVILVAV